MGKNAQIPSDFPIFFPLYPGAKTILAFTENGGKTGSLVQQTSDPHTQVQTWIEQTMQSQGFTKENTLTSPYLIILAFVKENIRCQVNIGQQGTQAQIQTACVEL